LAGITGSLNIPNLAGRYWKKKAKDFLKWGAHTPLVLKSISWNIEPYGIGKDLVEEFIRK